MDRLEHHQRTLADLDSKIAQWKESKKRMIDYVYSKDLALRKGLIRKEEYDRLVDEYLQGKSLSYWVHYHNEHLRKAYALKNETERKIFAIRHRKLMESLSFVFILVLFGIGYMLNPSITGRVTYGSESLTTFINATINESSVMDIQTPDNITSLRITGQMRGEGRIKVYLDNRIVVDSALLEDEGGLGSITGMVVDDLDAGSDKTVDNSTAEAGEPTPSYVNESDEGDDEQPGETPVYVPSQTVEETNGTDATSNITVGLHNATIEQPIANATENATAGNETVDIPEAVVPVLNNTANETSEDAAAGQNATIPPQEPVLENITEYILNNTLNQTINETAVPIVNDTQNITQNETSGTEPAMSFNKTIDFTEICEETCLLDRWPSGLKLRFEIESGSQIYVESISVTYLFIEEDVNQVNITIPGNQTGINFTANITTNMTGNLSLNITMNQTLNITPNMSINLSNITIDLGNLTLNFTNTTLLNMTPLNQTGNFTVNETASPFTLEIERLIGYGLNRSINVTIIDNNGTFTMMLDMMEQNRSSATITGIVNLSDIDGFFLGSLDDDRLSTDTLILGNFTRQDVEARLAKSGNDTYVDRLLRCSVVMDMACRNWVVSGASFTQDSTHVYIGSDEWIGFVGSREVTRNPEYITPLSIYSTSNCPHCVSQTDCAPVGICPRLNHYTDRKSTQAEFDFDVYGVKTDGLIKAEVCAYNYYQWDDMTRNYIRELDVSTCSNRSIYTDYGDTPYSSLIRGLDDWNCIDVTGMVTGRIGAGNSNLFMSWVGNELNGDRGPFNCIRGYSGLEECGGANPSGASDCRPYIKLYYSNS